MKQFEITAEKRGVSGKGASRRLRRSGFVPAILYGAGQEPLQLQINHNELQQHVAYEAFSSHVLTLNVDGSKQRVVLKDLQRHPFRRQILHMDLQRVDENQKITMHVPIHFMHEDKCVGVKLQGGNISHLMTDIEVICLPKDLPEFITVDVSEMAVGDTIHIADLILPENVGSTVLAHGGDPTLPVVSVHTAKGGGPESGTGEEETGAVGE